VNQIEAQSMARPPRNIARAMRAYDAAPGDTKEVLYAAFTYMQENRDARQVVGNPVLLIADLHRIVLDLLYDLNDLRESLP
jgi:hypothetical protein